MKHRIVHRKLGRNTAHRQALLKNLLRALVIHEKIKTTDEKAKELRRLFDRVVTWAKAGDLAHIRLISRIVPDRKLIKKLMDDIAPKMQNRNGGFVRIVKLGVRKGNGARVSILEIVN